MEASKRITNNGDEMKTIHSEEFMDLLNDYAEACEGAPMVVVDAAARALISHIDKHCAEVVEQAGSVTALADEMKVELNELLAKLWMCEKRDFISNRDAVFALFDRAVAASVQAQPLVDAAREIVGAMEKNAAPFKVEYALTQVDMVSIDSGLLLVLVKALPSPPVKEAE